MKAIAVIPGKPNTIHLRDVAKPSLEEISNGRGVLVKLLRVGVDGTLAYALAPTGKCILLLERGDNVLREKANWGSRAVNVEGKYQTKEVWQDQDGKPLHPHTNYYVGGNTKFHGAALFRLRKEDLGEIRHRSGGLSPVHGARGEDPTEPRASGPYPHPPASNEPRIQQLHEELARLGCRPFHVPLGVRVADHLRERLG